jgi:small subunit ribosomal protein S20
LTKADKKGIFYSVINLILLENKVANTKQAKKRIKQSEKARQRNAALRSMYRTCIKKVVHAIDLKDKNSAENAYKSAVPVLDSMVNKKIIHKNKASRHKSRLLLKINNL